MNVRLRIQFKPPIKDDWRAMRSLAKSLTDDPKGIRVSADPARSRDSRQSKVKPESRTLLRWRTLQGFRHLVRMPSRTCWQ